MLGFQRGAKHPFGQGQGSMPCPLSRAPRSVRCEFTKEERSDFEWERADSRQD